MRCTQTSFSLASPRLLSLVVALVGVLLAGPAFAAVTVSQVERTNSDHIQGATHYINYSDCSTAEGFTFTLTGHAVDDAVVIHGTSTGADCSVVAPDAGLDCHNLLSSTTLTSTTITVPLTATQIATGSGISTIDSSCADTATAQTHNVTLYFVNTTDSTSTTLEITVDTDGPEAPSSVSASVNDSGKVDVSFGSVTDAATYKAYCQKSDEVGSEGTGGSDGTGGSGGATSAGGSGGSGGASGGAGGSGGATSAGGTGGTGGAGGTGTGGSNFYAADAGGSSSDSATCTLDSSATCETLTQVSDSLLTAEVTGLAAITVSGLEDCVVYSCVVVATDEYGNEGEVSETTCGLSGPVTDFFENYRALGGKAGGGCVLTSPASDERRGLLALLLGLGLTWFWRRERRGGSQ
ncbi:MAG: hypothetical protein VB934_17795 [Polyangiaceae bacterium]